MAVRRFSFHRPFIMDATRMDPLKREKVDSAQSVSSFRGMKPLMKHR